MKIDATVFDDVAGAIYAGISDTATLSFTTGDTIDPALTSTLADNATVIAVDSSIVLTFSEIS